MRGPLPARVSDTIFLKNEQNVNTGQGIVQIFYVIDKFGVNLWIKHVMVQDHNDTFSNTFPHGVL